MTAFLLDSHALVWAVAIPDRLGTRAHEAIADPRSDLVVSAATAWELSTKLRTGRFPEAEPIVSGFSEICRRMRTRPLPITEAHALRAGSMRWSHRDPFDRMLAAQALVEDLTLVTMDAAFNELGGLRVLW